jgi:hypothetical protein
MSTMQIEIVANPVSTVPTAKGSYQVIDLAYKNKSFQDKLEGKKVMSFTNKDVFAALQKASFGDVFNVSRVKNDKGFWDWTAVSSDVLVADVPSSVSISSAPVKTGNVTPKSNYETAEERAARQVLIVRQSSISSAVEFAVANKLKTTGEVLEIARKFEEYVFGKEVTATVEETPPGNFFEDMEDDLP